MIGVQGQSPSENRNTGVQGIVRHNPSMRETALAGSNDVVGYWARQTGQWSLSGGTLIHSTVLVTLNPAVINNIWPYRGSH
jgi:hypothetical protein